MADVPIPVSPENAARLGFRSEQHMQRLGNRMFREREKRNRAMRAASDPDIILSDAKAQLLVICGLSLREQELRDAIEEYITLMAFHVTQGRTVTYDDTYEGVNRIAEEHDFLSGVPIPIVGTENNPDLVMASGVPLAEIFHMAQEHRRAEAAPRTEMERHLRERHIRVRNSWHVLGDGSVSIIDAEGGSPVAWREWDAGMRLRKMVRGMMVRQDAHQTAEAEFKALESLKQRVNEHQFNCYVLSGMFIEKSKRSGVYYYFRKGLPTLAISHNGAYANTGKVLCALCLHPMGFYQGTHCGLMCPTDEVISHLLWMRSDEHGFWKKSGQWSAEDTRSGI
jgi:hypothetical protein